MAAVFTDRMFVKLIVAVLFIIIVLNVQGEQLNQKNFRKRFMEAVRKCSAEFNVQKGISFTYFVNADSASKCFTMCLLDDINLMDRKGNYRIESMKPFVNSMPKSRFKDSIERNLDSCLKENNQKDPCEKGYRFVRCFYTKASYNENEPSSPPK